MTQLPMKLHFVQYSRPHNAVAISEWREYIVKVYAQSTSDAIRRLNRKLNSVGGVWHIMDCWAVDSSFCKCGNPKMEESEFCKDCI